jgi:hypothetical protein
MYFITNKGNITIHTFTSNFISAVIKEVVLFVFRVCYGWVSLMALKSWHVPFIRTHKIAPCPRCVQFVSPTYPRHGQNALLLKFVLTDAKRTCATKLLNQSEYL